MKSRKNKSAVNAGYSGHKRARFYFMPATSPAFLNTPYIGRFAPSPTGLLHFGSLVSALASFLDARACRGTWLVRMEDLDPPREQSGAADAILQALEQHGLTWDGEVVFQSRRHAAYEALLHDLQRQHLIYRCDCTRQDLQTMGGIYNGRCRTRLVDTSHPHALRLKLYDTSPLPDDRLEFTDLFQGQQIQNLRLEAGDQILKRKDGLFAYQLAVVADDMAQGITHIIRGLDLLPVTARQIAFFNICHRPAPLYGHVPIAINQHGQKLSKQNLALPLDGQKASGNLWYALAFLGQRPPPELKTATVAEILAWGVQHWQREQVAAMPREALSPLLSGEEYPHL